MKNLWLHRLGRTSGWVLFMLALALSLTVVAAAAEIPVQPVVGSQAPDFTLASVEGGTVSLSDFRGKRVFLNFWATWCPPCRVEMPDIQAVYEEKEEDVVFLAVNLQEPQGKVQEFLQAQGLTFPVVLDTTGIVAGAYWVRAIPTSFVIDAEGIITGKHIGVLNASLLTGMLEKAKGE